MKVDVKTKFFQDASGEFYIGVYPVETILYSIFIVIFPNGLATFSKVVWDYWTIVAAFFVLVCGMNFLLSAEVFYSLIALITLRSPYVK